MIEGNIYLKDTKDSYFRSENRLIVGIGLENLVVVETNDAILISDKKQTQKVKDMVNLLNENNITESYQHQKIYKQPTPEAGGPPPTQDAFASTRARRNAEL